MTLHVSSKIAAVAFVIAALITAFSNPTPKNILVMPTVEVLVPVMVEPLLTIKRPIMVAEDAPVAGPDASLSFLLRATAYNSLPEQTNDQPFITATGARTRFGIIAVSRDLLTQDIPYGSLVRIKDLGNFYNGRNAGHYQPLLDSQGLFIVEDTMHPRKTQQIDLWFAHLSEALNWGVRQVELEVVRYGREGPEFYSQGQERNFSIQ